MKKKLTAAFAVILFIIFPAIGVTANSINNGSINGSVNNSVQITTVPDHPVHIQAPSIGLNAPVEGVNVVANGDMAVPPGLTKDVGWYEKGVLPGNPGTAVLDAHIFAAFINLHKIQVGSSIYITMASGKIFHFVVTASNLYPLATLSPYTLFAPTSSTQINLITCAGNLSADGTTYDHRLIVTAQLD